VNNAPNTALLLVVFVCKRQHLRMLRKGLGVYVVRTHCVSAAKWAQTVVLNTSDRCLTKSTQKLLFSSPHHTWMEVLAV
jgi:hypothetical protein